MNLISCGNCGVVLDKDKLKLPDADDIYLEDGSVDVEKAIWNGRDYVPFFKCPVCTDAIY